MTGEANERGGELPIETDELVVTALAALRPQDLEALLGGQSADVRAEFLAHHDIHSVRPGAMRLLRTKLAKLPRGHRLRVARWFAHSLVWDLREQLGGPHADPSVMEVAEEVKAILGEHGAANTRLALAVIAETGRHAATEAYVVMLSSEELRLPAWPAPAWADLDEAADGLRGVVVNGWSHAEDCADHDDEGAGGPDVGAVDEREVPIFSVADGGGNPEASLRRVLSRIAMSLPRGRQAAARIVAAIDRSEPPNDEDIAVVVELREHFAEGRSLAAEIGLSSDGDVSLDGLTKALDDHVRLLALRSREYLWRRAAAADGSAADAVDELHRLAADALTGRLPEPTVEALELLIRLVDAVSSEADDLEIVALDGRIRELTGDEFALLVLAAIRGRLQVPIGLDQPESDASAAGEEPEEVPGERAAEERATNDDIEGLSIGAGESDDCATGTVHNGPAVPVAAEATVGEREAPLTNGPPATTFEEDAPTDLEEPLIAPVSVDEQARAGLEKVTREAAIAALASAIGDRRYGLAHWIARATGDESRSEVLAVAALANAVRSANGRCASALQERLVSVEADGVELGPAENVLLLGAVSRASLLAPSSLLPPHLRALSLAFDDMENVKALARGFERASYAGVHVVADKDLGVSAVALIERELQALASAAGRLLDDGPRRTLKFPRATDIWREWIDRRRGAIGGVLAMVEQGDVSHAQTVQREIEPLRTAKGRERRLEEADRERRMASNHPTRLTAGARVTLLGWAADAVELVAEWLDAARRLEAANQASSAPGPLVDLRKSIADHGSAALNELTYWSQAPERDPVAVAVGRATGAMLNETFKLLNGEGLTGIEASPEEALGRDLLLVPELPMNGLQPLHQPQLSSLIGIPGRTLEEAFQERAALADHVGTATIIELIRRVDPLQAEGLEAGRAEMVAAQRAATESLRRGVETDVGRARRLGTLDDDHFAALRERLDAVRPYERFDFGVLTQELEAIRDEVALRENLSLAEASRRLAEQVERHPELRAVEPRVRALIDDHGDLATAEEIVLLALLGDSEAATTHEEPSFRLEDFFPAVPAALTARPLDDSAASDAEGGKKWGPFDFSRLSPDARLRSAEALLQWWRLGAGAFTGKQLRIEPILTLLGIAATAIEPVTELRSDNSAMWLELVHVTRFGKALVPAFGSDVGDRMRILLVAGYPSETKLLEVVAQDHGHGGVLVLYFGTLTPDQRRNLAEMTRPKRRGRAVGVVDDAVVAALAAAGNDDFELTMRMVLPFVSLNPYTPFNSGEVPEEMFFGRRVESREVREPRGTSFVFGGRQLGKSALLLEAHRRFSEGSGHRTAVYVDLRAAGVGSAEGPHAVWDLLSARFTDVGVFPERLVVRDDPRVFTDAVASWLRDSPERSILLLLDESDAFLKADSEARVSPTSDERFPAVTLFKDLAQQTQRRFKVVFAGLHQVQRFQQIPNHPLLQLGMGSSIAIGPLSPADARALVESPLHALGYRFDDPGLVDYILTQSAYQPSVLQLVCNALTDHLLSRVRGRVGPPYAITANDVDRAFEDPAMADEIRRRFLGTINLDDRYKVIAYSVAHAALEHEAPLAESELRDVAAGWWPAGFAGVTPDEFRSLLSEMVGLGVLVHVDGDYRLRNSLVRRYLGTSAEIEEVLLCANEFEPSMQFEASTYRRCLSPTPDQRSPLTDAQLADLCAKRSQVRVLVGSPALGWGSLHKAFDHESKRNEIKLSWIKAANLTRRLKDQPQESHRVLVVDFSGLRSELAAERLMEIRDGVAQASSMSIAAVALVGTDHLGLWKKIAAETLGDQIPITQLRRWDRVAVKTWAANVDVPFQDETSRKALLDVTGGWPTLVSRVAELLHGSPSLPDKALAALRVQLEEEEMARGFVASTGVTEDPGVEAAWRTLVDWGDPALADDLVTLLDDLEAPLALLAVMRMLGILEETSDGRLRVEPVLTRAWAAGRY